MIQKLNSVHIGKNYETCQFDPSVLDGKSLEQSDETKEKYRSSEAVFEEFRKELRKELISYSFKGVTFYDIFSLLTNPYLFSGICMHMNLLIKKADFIVSPEARGFLFGPTIAVSNGMGFIPFRKEGKLPFTLPSTIHKTSYACEYETGRLEFHNDHLRLSKAYQYDLEVANQKAKLSDNETVDEFSEKKTAVHNSDKKSLWKRYSEDQLKDMHPKVVIVDDVLATGGTLKSIALSLIEHGFEVVQVLTVLEIGELKGRKQLDLELGLNVNSLLTV
jgi:adenine/guanine phosphoribosyltransferase-like PRPP-binding protein